MNEIYISDTCNHYNPNKKTINLHYRNMEIKDLNDNELIEYTADVITHEYLHYVLHKHFNLCTSFLMDTVEDKLRLSCRSVLDLKIYNNQCNFISHTNFIKKYGFTQWLKSSGLYKYYMLHYENLG